LTNGFISTPSHLFGCGLLSFHVLIPLSLIFSARDSKEVTLEEYKLFYQSTFKDFKEPLAWSHFSLTTESGIAFRAIIYVPSGLEEKFWQQPTSSVNVRLMVKHVFITSDLGEDALPKWISWVKAVVDGVYYQHHCRYSYHLTFSLFQLRIYP
jgi:hypothetical protein